MSNFFIFFEKVTSGYFDFKTSFLQARSLGSIFSGLVSKKKDIFFIEKKNFLDSKDNMITDILLKEFKEAGGVIPSNLVIRLSATMINGAPSKTHAHSSTVHTPGVEPIGEACNASHQGGRCLDCRACWNSSIKNISYEKH